MLVKLTPGDAAPEVEADLGAVEVRRADGRERDAEGDDFFAAPRVDRGARETEGEREEVLVRTGMKRWTRERASGAFWENGA